MSEFKLKLREDRPATIQERRELLNEIERLRSIAFGAEEYAQTVRRTTIEECAREAETWDYGWGDSAACDGIAAAIRALKDKP